MRKFINTYKSHSIESDIYKQEFVIDSLEALHEFIDTLNEGNALSWLFHKGKEQFVDAPKIRELQQQANDLRCRAAMEEENFRNIIKKAIQENKSFDLEKLKQVLIKKKRIFLSTAQEYENQAIEAAGTNQYLITLQRTLRNEGLIAANRILLKNATEEEVYHLNTADNTYRSEIEVDLSDIHDMMGTKRSSDPEHDNREEVHRTGKNIFHKGKDSLDRKANEEGWNEEDIKNTERTISLFLKREYREKLNKKHGIPKSRKSANVRYDFIDDLIEYMKNHPKVSERDAWSIIRQEYIKTRNFDIDNPPK